MKKIFVSGGEHYRDSDKIAESLNAVLEKHKSISLITTNAIGCEYDVRVWAEENGVKYTLLCCLWQDTGNYSYVREPDLDLDLRAVTDHKPDAAIVFPGGERQDSAFRMLKREGVPTWDLRRLQ